MAQSQVFQAIESTVYLYGGHFQQNFPNWHYPQEQHQLFEMIVVLQGTETVFMGTRRCLLSAGEAMIITPETAHESFNFCGNRLRFFCFHFSVGDLALKTQIIQNLGNTVLAADTPLAQAAQRLIQRFSALQAAQQQPDWTLNMEIAFLEFMAVVSQAPRVVAPVAQLPEQQVILAQKMATLLFQEGPRPQSFQAVCAALNFSTTYGHTVFKRVYGITPSTYTKERRFSRAKVLLEIGEKSMAEIAVDLAFSSQASFSKQFKLWSGMTPSDFRQTQRRHQSQANYLNQ
ncbi:helix-turn-helix domain-containing protein [Levilactobacillus brevis]|uniref:helix-turn-helix domain-containing protein n=1 Tax=Levilactobacillus brevis TaxID=1580 RepID=UPI000A20C199|nr:AraC family transcriptional regulator [Levilactobacillus brevis]ARN89200.1 AraC family transcriptional regulator [Levilactobacillus brevis]ARN96783.1 AraC family transcriptional regulator [Levilactobacillus brevis]